MSTRIETLTTVHDGWLRVKLAKTRTDDGSLADREIVEQPDAAAVLLYDPDKRTALLVSQLRTPVELAGEPRLLEAVAGLLDEPDPAACARREAMEEAGVAVGTMEHVARLWSTPGTSTERLDLYLAAISERDRVAEGGGLDEEHEGIRVQEIGLGELWRMAESGAIADAKTFVLVQALRIRRPELF